MTNIIFILLLLLVLLLWSNALKAREQALAAVRQYCHKMELQLLDDCVALNGLWLRRDSHGKLRFWRSYGFEFSATGFERYHGKIVLLGRKIESIMTEPYKIDDF